MVKEAMRRLAIGSLCAMWAGMACAVPTECPASIQVQESLRSAQEEGWAVAADESPRSLAGITLFDGDPSQGMSIAPARDLRAGKDRVAVWVLDGPSNDIWMGCRYLGSTIVLSRKLPRFRECRLTYGPGGVVRRMDCRN